MKDERIKVNSRQTEIEEKLIKLAKLEKSYDSYIKNKELVIESATLGVTTLTIGSLMFLNPMIVVALVICSVLGVNVVKETYKKELLQLLSIGELGDVEEIEKYYEQLPQDLQKEWLRNKVFPKLADYLKNKFPENKIYSDEQELVDFNAEPLEDSWTLLGKD